MPSYRRIGDFYKTSLQGTRLNMPTEWFHISQYHLADQTDFGYASFLPGPAYSTYYTSFQGTRKYLRPEFFQNNTYSPFPALTWSIGCFACFILIGRPPIRSNNFNRTYSRITVEMNLEIFSSGSCPVNSAAASYVIGKLCTSRWLTYTSRVLRLYISCTGPDSMKDAVKVLASYIVKVYYRVPKT